MSRNWSVTAVLTNVFATSAATFALPNVAEGAYRPGGAATSYCAQAPGGRCHAGQLGPRRLRGRLRCVRAPKQIAEWGAIVRPGIRTAPAIVAADAATVAAGTDRIAVALGARGGERGGAVEPDEAAPRR